VYFVGCQDQGRKMETRKKKLSITRNNLALFSSVPGDCLTWCKKLAGFSKSITPAGVGFRLFERPIGLWSRGGLMAAWQLASIGSMNKDDQCTNNASSI
jgi:hypothetical protein